MSARSFFTSFSLLSLGTALFIFGLTNFPQFQSSTAISWISLLIFGAICVLMYFSGVSSAKSKDKNAFTRLIIMSIMAKMFIAILMVVVYIEVVKAESRLFIYPFLAIYFIYTIFETYFMTKLGKTEN